MGTRIDVAPLVYIPRPHRGLFSYRTPRALPRGAVVVVPLGKRTVPGIVWGHATPQQDGRRLKPVLDVLEEQALLPSALLEYLSWESRATVTPLGALLKLATPLWEPQKDVFGFGNVMIKEKNRKRTAGSFHFLHGERVFPAREYAKVLSQQMRMRRQSLIIVPTRTAQTTLLRALPSRLGVLPAPQKKMKDSREVWLRIRAGEPLVIVGTARALRLPFVNLGLLIVDDVTNVLWKETRSHPYTDGRAAAKKLAQVHGAKIIFSGFFLPLEHETAKTSRISIIGTRHKKNTGGIEIIDLKAQPPRDGLSHALVRTVREIMTKNPKAHVLFFMNRRGTAPALHCRDCGFVFTCTHCDAPVSVFRIDPLTHQGESASIGERNELRCRHCGKTFIPPLVCPSCRGFRLQARGFGGEKTEEAVKKFFPGVWVGRFDTDTARTRAAQQETLFAFMSQQGPAFLVATAMALNHELPLFDLVALPAADQLFVAPDLAAEENTYGILLRLKALVKRKGKFLIQTWHPENSLFAYATVNDFADFRKRELALRKQFELPPFRRLAKLTFSNRDNGKTAAEAARLAKCLHHEFSTIRHSLSAEIVGPYPAFIPRLRGRYIWHILVKWRPKNENDLRVEDRLWRSVSPIWDIDIYPVSIL